jgi:hypothetical protein
MVSNVEKPYDTQNNTWVKETRLVTLISEKGKMALANTS